MAVSKKQAQEQLQAGGQRVFQQAEAEIYTRHGYNDDGSPALERQTGAGMKTKVHQLLDPRLDLTDAQRAAGNYFGHLYQVVATGGGGGAGIAERVDVTRTSGSGVAEARLNNVRCLRVAMEALTVAPSITYPKGTPRPGRYQGQHKPIRPFQLLHMVCVNQRTLSQVAIAYDWTRAEINSGKVGKRVVPDRQRKHLAAALRDTLEQLSDKWVANGYGALFELGSVHVR